MNVRETFKTALRSLSLNKIRSFLTMLGVIIGVFAVVSLVSLVQGVRNYVQDQFESLGSNLIFVASGNVGSGGGSPAQGLSSSNLKEEHADTIRLSAGDYIDLVTPTIQTMQPVKYKTQSYYSRIVGVNYQADKMFSTYAEDGRYFNKSEESSSARVAVIGYALNKKLFGEENSLNKKIKVDGKSYEIVGVLSEKNPDYDEALLIPYTTVLDNFKGASIISIVSKAKKDVNLDDAAEQVKLAMLRDLKSNEFTVMTQKDILDSIGSILNILTIALAAVSGISLVVGGIGIMNIMLVSVTERTREIGLRKALGATSKDIKLQFVIEAVLISLAGGILGLFFGWVATLAARPYLRAEIPFWAILMSLGFSIAVGVIFGTYPAVKASQKDPIEALRYE